MTFPAFKRHSLSKKQNSGNKKSGKQTLTAPSLTSFKNQPYSGYFFLPLPFASSGSLLSIVT
jgi:hypothetical protein